MIGDESLERQMVGPVFLRPSFPPVVSTRGSDFHSLVGIFTYNIRKTILGAVISPFHFAVTFRMPDREGEISITISAPDKFSSTNVVYKWTHLHAPACWPECRCNFITLWIWVGLRKYGENIIILAANSENWNMVLIVVYIDVAT